MATHDAPDDIIAPVLAHLSTLIQKEMRERTNASVMGALSDAGAQTSIMFPAPHKITLVHRGIAIHDKYSARASRGVVGMRH